MGARARSTDTSPNPAVRHGISDVFLMDADGVQIGASAYTAEVDLYIGYLIDLHVDFQRMAPTVTQSEGRPQSASPATPSDCGQS
jgi:hypothetical protein